MYGHFGGFITGLLLGFTLMRRVRRIAQTQESSFEKLIWKVGAGGLIFYFGLLITLFLTVAHPP